MRAAWSAGCGCAAVIVAVVLVAGMIGVCGAGEISVPWTLSGIAREGRELHLAAFRTSACDELGEVEVDESDDEVEIDVRVRRSDDVCILILPGPRAITVDLDTALGDRELVHADANPGDVGSPGVLPRLQQRERELLEVRSR